MTLLLRASDLVGLPVVPADSGDDVAEVKDVVYDPDRHDLVGFTLNKRGFLAGTLDRYLPAGNVVGAGPDAVVVAAVGDLVRPEEAPSPLTGTSRDRDVLGDRVISEDGVELGEITDVILLAGSKLAVVGYEIGGPRWEDTPGGRAYVPVGAQVSVSGEALIVPSQAVEYVRDDLSGFASAVDEFRRRLGGGRWADTP